MEIYNNKCNAELQLFTHAIFLMLTELMTLNNKNNGALVTTHRLSAVQIADKIAVIIYGTHSEPYKTKTVCIKKCLINRQNSMLKPQMNKSGYFSNSFKKERGCLVNLISLVLLDARLIVSVS